MIPVSLILISQDLAQLQLTEDSSDCIYLSEDQDQFIQQLQNISREQQRLHLKNGGHLILKSGQFQYLPRGLQRLKLDSNNNNPFISLTDRVYAYLPSSLKILSLDMDSKFFKSAVCQPSFYERFPRLQLLHLQNTGNLNLTALCANAPKGVRVTDDVGVFFKEFRKPLSPLAEIVDPLLDVLSTTELTGDLVSMVVAYCAEDVLRRADIQGDMRALSPAMQKSLRQFAHTWTILDLSYLALTDESLCDILKCAENKRVLA
ncbi:MAG: hypothetical protein JWO53_44, partial [Chlamydiia bacterium]|nr:hypothetical protein [Chlamydiia bacterium]